MVKTDVMGVAFDDLTMAQAVDRGLELAAGPGFSYAVTPNPELVMMARRDPDYAKALAGAALTLADGIGVIYAAKLLGRPLSGRVPGVDFAGELMARMAQEGLSLFLLGAKPGVAQRAAENLRKRYPGLDIRGVHDGYFQDDGPVVEAVRASGADVVFVCLGAPKQEFWMAKNGSASGAHLMVGLGGSLDVFAGTVKRAPERWQRLGLEWLYRLGKEPKRIGRMAKLPLFLLQAVGARLSPGGDRSRA